MRVFIDTNILVSASKSSKSSPYLAFVKAVSHPNQGDICDQNIVELHRVYMRKFPDYYKSLETFLDFALPVLEVVSVPEEETKFEEKVRDINDRPILRAAIKAEVDILITGDKDFLESELTVPLILTAAEFLQLKE
ncbi:MAG: putative toxin-antitoxin system toxin component, PIN family [Fusobacteriaceae bacterium]|nr:putative toxin-antitoxin system toxin component, PIN family [Fusobacteriaceae bacterium]